MVATDSPSSRGLALLTLTGLVVSRVLLALTRTQWTHDEMITRLAATCHQRAYFDVEAGAPPHGEWVEAAQWQRFVDPSDLGVDCWGEIATGLTTTDIHPPLYFDLAHLWSTALGSFGGLGEGVLLNLAFALLAAFALVDLGRQTGLSPRLAWGACALWSLSVGAMSVSFAARQYELYGLLTITSVACFARAYTSPRRFGGPWLFVLVGLGVLGLLTHYQFALVLVTLCVVALMLPRQHRLGFTACTMVASLVAGVTALTLHPGVWASVGRASEQAQAFALSSLAARVLQLALGWASFAIGDDPVSIAVALATLGALGWAALEGLPAPEVVSSERHRGGSRLRRVVAWLRAQTKGTTPSPERLVPWTLAILGAAIALTYLAHSSPDHAVGARHYAPLWPLLALTLVGARPCWAWLERGGGWHVAVAPIMAFAGLAGATAQQQLDAPPQQLARARVVVVDTVRRGLLLQALVPLRADALVFAADQATLAKRLPEHMPEGGPVLYISSPHYGNDPEVSDEIFRLLAQHMGRDPKQVGEVLSAPVYLFERH